jgi:hypothetical protein
MLLGELTRLETRNSELVVGVGGGEAADGEEGGGEVVLDRQNALRFLGVEAADDIALSTVVSLKKESLLNTRIALKIEQKDGRTTVR